MASGGGGRKYPPVGEKFVKNGKCYAYDFYTLLPKFVLASLSNIIHGAGGPDELICGLIVTDGKRKSYCYISTIFECFS